jgi:hypothetical protein
MPEPTFRRYSQQLAIENIEQDPSTAAASVR